LTGRFYRFLAKYSLRDMLPVSLKTLSVLRDKCVFVDGLGWVMNVKMLVS